jgi:predicted methyltransferase
MKRLAIVAAMAVLMSPGAFAQNPAESAWLAIEGRSEADIRLDEGRKPVETLSFLGIRKGDVALDYMAGGGYYSEIIARAVGPKGRVVAWNPKAFVASDRAKAKWADLTARFPTIEHRIAAFDGFTAEAGRFDFALFHLVYHDLYWESAQYEVPRTDPDAVLKRLFAAMKPGGIVGVIDHRGAAGDTRAIVESTHRIDPAVVKADFERAGFRLAGESAHLRIAGDDPAKNVFDPALRGKTDRFVLKFVKPE